MNRRSLASGIASALFVLALSAPALAHKPGLSRLEAKSEGQSILVDVTFARDELLALDDTVDADRSGTLDEGELRRAAPGVERRVVSRVGVTRGGKPCEGKLTSLTNEENDGVSLHTRYQCADPSLDVTITFGLFDDLSAGHRCLAEFGDGGAAPEEAVLSRDRPTATFHAVTSPSTPPSGNTRELGSFGRIVLLGIEHILTGWDHLLFLFGLVLVGGSWRSTLAVVSAFTLAHSITLAMAALGIWVPSPRLVEPAIALSIAYVGVENFLVQDIARRWRITFPFGLVHGFGFAGALAEVRIPHDRLVTTLVGFNLGVELGQIGVLLLVVPLLALLRKRDSFRTRGVQILSGIIVLVGIALFVERIREG